LLAKAPSLVGGQLVNDPSPPVEPVPIAPSAQAPAVATIEPDPPLSSFEAALGEQLARMAKFKMSLGFLRGALVPGIELELGEVAMSWAGMPNKHERALTNDVLDALAAAGYLEHLEPERYRVTRGAES
jgi:hypothetical protein